jgi:hypothetical protein
VSLRPGFGFELLEMRRFGDRRPSGNTVVIIDDWTIGRLVREKLKMFALVVEPFAPYDLTMCHDLDVWVVMRGDSHKVRSALKRARPRSAIFDSGMVSFTWWLEWLAKARVERAAVLAPA